MSWALGFNGTSNRVSFSAVDLSLNDTVSFEYIADTLVNTYQYFCDSDGSGNRPYVFQLLSNGKIGFNTASITVKIDGVSAVHNTTVLPESGLHCLEITAKGNCRFGSIFQRLNGVDKSNFKLISCVITKSTGEVFHLDATASDHSNTGSQPVLIDTIGSNNAIGRGFAEDGSAWIDLGGGTISSSVNVTWPMFEVSAVQASDAPAISSSVNVTWPMFEVSAVQASDAPAISSSVAATWSMFEVSAAQASEAPAISSSVNVTFPMFEVSAVVGKFDYYTDPSARIEINSSSRRIDINSASRRIDL